MRFFTALLLFFSAGRLHAAGEAAQFLELVPSARASALGEAVVSEPGLDVAGMNPAAAAYTPALSFSGSHLSLADDVNLEEVFLGFPSVIGTFYGHGLFLNSPDLPALDSTGKQVGVISARESAAGLGWAYGWGQLSLGVEAKALFQTLGFSDGTGDAFSAGAQWQVLPGFNIGASLRDAGTLSGLISAEDSLQPSSSVGASYRIPITDKETIEPLLALNRDAAGDLRLAGALELGLGRLAFLRGAYQFFQPDSTVLPFSAGLGIRWQSLSLDGAWVPYGDLGQSYRVTASFEIGGSPEAAGANAPSNLRIEADPNAGWVLKWDAPSGSSGWRYKVYLRDKPEDAARQLNAKLLKDPQVRIRAFQAGRRYRFTVTALDGDGVEGPASRELNYLAEQK
jgi:hypothetical protein